MIFALVDYMHYRTETGRFAKHAPTSPMGAAFARTLPQGIVDLLEPGDCIFTCRYGSMLLWAVMYFTSSEISHVAMYIGDGLIAHATLGGILKQEISTLFGDDARLLPVHIGTDSDQQEALRRNVERILGRSFGWRSVRTKLLRILSGRDMAYFRWRFLFDAAIVIACCDFPFILTTGRPVLAWLLPAYVLLVLVNWVLWRTRPILVDEDYVKPIDLYMMLLASGAQPMVDGHALDEQRRQRGLRPLSRWAEGGSKKAR